MARISPIAREDAPPEAREEWDRQVAAYGRMTHMKRTLARSPLALRAYMEWYPLRDRVEAFLGRRATLLFVHAISSEADCLICSTYFRRHLIEAGEDPDALVMDEQEQALVALGRQIARDDNHVTDDLWNAVAAPLRPEDAVTLVAFAGIMVATNLFNNVLHVDLDEYLMPFRQQGDAMSLKGKTALITGAAHGQGRAAALALAREGVQIAALDVGKPLAYPGYAMGTTEELATLRKDVESRGVACLTFAADVRDVAGVRHAVKETRERFGRIDILFNNAGICGYGLSHELSEEAWDTMLDVNLKGAWIVGREVIPIMIAQRSGVILNNSSVAGRRGMARLSHYVASKWGLTGLTKSWAIELAPYGIRVVSIHPTGVNTPMNDGLAALEGKTPREIGEVSAANLLAVPWIEPEDVAEAVVFLASDKARFVTGSEFVLDAGLLTR